MSLHLRSIILLDQYSTLLPHLTSVTSIEGLFPNTGKLGVGASIYDFGENMSFSPYQLHSIIIVLTYINMLLKIIPALCISFLLKQHQTNQKNKEKRMHSGVGIQYNETTLIYMIIFILTPFSIFMPI